MASLRDGATPNGIQEREIYGVHPHQLRAAFRDLQALSQQSVQPETGGRSWGAGGRVRHHELEAGEGARGALYR